MPTNSFIVSFCVLSRLRLLKSLDHAINFQRHVRRSRNSSLRSNDISSTLQKLGLTATNNSDNPNDSNILKENIKDSNVLSALKKIKPVRPFKPAVFDEERLLAETVTPLYQMPYDDQLKKKYEMNVKTLKEFGKQLKACGAHAALGNDNMPCVLDAIIPSPVLKKYRNKDEFSILYNAEDYPKAVGFFIDNPSENPQYICVSPHDLTITHDIHKELAFLFELYIGKSSLPACYDFDDGGHWRNLIVRSNSKNEAMGIVVFHPQDMTQEQLELEKQRLLDDFVGSRFMRPCLVSLYFQACRHTRCTHQEAPFELVYGKPFLYEEMNGLTYRIGPESFFQTNTKAAEQLYKVILNACKVSKNTTVLDICCGVGPVSFTFAPHVKHCIGMDSSVTAIEDAKANAELNGITNVDFFAGNCQIILDKVFREVYAEDLIAVVNPARQALGNGVMRALRQCKHLKKILYVTCKPEAALMNFVALCEPSGKRKELGVPFYPMRAVPIDLFPQTNHCELVVLFQRL